MKPLNMSVYWKDKDMNLTQCIRGGSQDMRNGFILAFYYDLDTREAVRNESGAGTGEATRNLLPISTTTTE